MRFSNLHQHTTFSDGVHTMEEVVQEAIRRDFVSIGFSDHSFTPCDTSYCMKDTAYPAYFAEIQRLRAKYAGQIDVLTGLELDYYSEVDRTPFDYWIASVHYLILNGQCYPIDHSRAQQLACIEAECGGSLLEFARRYYDNVMHNVARSTPEIVGHFDVITKFGLIDDQDPAYQRIALAALDEVMKTAKRIEMNTGAIAKGIRSTPYPAPFLLRRVLENGGEVVLSADAHRADTIDCYFRECVAQLKQIGFDHIAQRTAAGWQRVPIG